MISSDQRALINSLTDSPAFDGLVNDIRQDLFMEWVQEPEMKGREEVYYRLKGLDSIVEILQEKIYEISSGDTKT